MAWERLLEFERESMKAGRLLKEENWTAVAAVFIQDFANTHGTGTEAEIERAFWFWCFLMGFNAMTSKRIWNEVEKANGLPKVT